MSKHVRRREVIGDPAAPEAITVTAFLEDETRELAWDMTSAEIRDEAGSPNQLDYAWSTTADHLYEAFELWLTDSTGFLPLTRDVFDSTLDGLGYEWVKDDDGIARWQGVEHHTDETAN